MIRDQVFISYSRKDKDWLERLQTMLAPLQRQGRLNVWADTRIQPGQLWKKEIQKALARAKIAVLLVSPDFLASESINKNELPLLLEAAQKDGLTGHDHRFGHSNQQIAGYEMQDQLRLKKQIDDLRHQWELHNEKLNRLIKQLILETRTEERFRQEKLIEDTKTERDQVEEQLKNMERQLVKVDSDAEEAVGRNDDQGRLTILWVLLRPSLYKATDIAHYEAIYDPSTPLSALTEAQQEAALAQIAEELMKKVQPYATPTAKQGWQLSTLPTGRLLLILLVLGALVTAGMYYIEKRWFWRNSILTQGMKPTDQVQEPSTTKPTGPNGPNSEELRHYQSNLTFMKDQVMEKAQTFSFSVHRPHANTERMHLDVEFFVSVGPGGKEKEGPVSGYLEIDGKRVETFEKEILVSISPLQLSDGDHTIKLGITNPPSARVKFFRLTIESWHEPVLTELRKTE